MNNQKATLSVAACIALLCSCVSTRTNDLRSKSVFLAKYRDLYLYENSFVRPDPKIKGTFYRAVLPYNVFWSRLANSPLKAPGIPACSASLMAAAPTEAKARDLLLLAAKEIGITESTQYLVTNRKLVDRNELESLAANGAPVSAFFKWATETKSFRK